MTSQRYDYTAEELRRFPTIRQSQDADLKYEKRFLRVWLSRLTTDDGEPYNDKITVERLIDGNWVIGSEYPG